MIFYPKFLTKLPCILPFPMESRKLIKLHTKESSHGPWESSISTLTWFEGDAAAASSILRRRVKEIIRLNPWLAGTLVRDSVMSIAFHEMDYINDSTLDLLFTYHDSLQDGESFSMGMEVSDLAVTAWRNEWLCRNGADIIKNGLQVFKVTVVRDTTAVKHFALIMSLSHRVGDGHTFYSIYNMMSASTLMMALNPVRKTHVFDEIERVTKKKGVAQNMSFWFSLRLSISMRWSKLKRDQPRLVTFMIDHQYIDQMKSESISHDPVASIISTNDVLASSCFKLGESDIAIMAVNFRNRVRDSKAVDAGNYISRIVYCPGEYESPSLIRQSILGPFYEAVTSPTSTLNTQNDSHILRKKPRTTLCTNWSGFVVDEFVIKGCKQLVHLPFGPPLSLQKASMTSCVIFKPARGQTAILVLGDCQIVKNFEASKLVHHHTEKLLNSKVRDYFFSAHEGCQM